MNQSFERCRLKIRVLLFGDAFRDGPTDRPLDPFAKSHNSLVNVMVFCGISSLLSPPYTKTVGLQIAFTVDFFAPETVSTKRPGAISNRYDASLRASADLPFFVEFIMAPLSARLMHSWVSRFDLAVRTGHLRENIFGESCSRCARSTAGSMMLVRREFCSSAVVEYGTTTVKREARSSVMRLRYAALRDLKDFWLVKAVSVSDLHSLQC